MLKYLRIAVTALSLTACVLLIALWVRSYWWADFVSGPFSGTKGLIADSTEGWLTIRWVRARPSLATWTMKHESLKLRDEQTKKAIAAGNIVSPPPRSFGLHPFRFQLPHWFAVILSVSFAGLPWMATRFSLRTLLIATTLVAVVLGVIAVSS